MKSRTIVILSVSFFVFCTMALAADYWLPDNNFHSLLKLDVMYAGQDKNEEDPIMVESDTELAEEMELGENQSSPAGSHLNKTFWFERFAARASDRSISIRQ